MAQKDTPTSLEVKKTENANDAKAGMNDAIM
ncbi:MAG: hypothetical protein HW412_1834, partial [Bacteroidetes bacterium]|nr:hypothetical protein [Bacteroidota bacterium]